MVVQRVFKGNVKVQDAIDFVQGNGIDCLWSFDETDIGKEYLLYLIPPDKASDLWAVGQGRSAELNEAIDDLLYLNNIEKVHGKTRVSGTLDDDFPVAGTIVRIIGKTRTFETKADEHGVYEIYGLPAGKYLIAPKMPDGWIIDVDEDSLPTVSERRVHSTKFKAFTLRPKRHAVINFTFELDNVVEGQVFDQNGRPLSEASIVLMPEKDDGGESSQFIDKKGRFKFESVSAGRYNLIIHEPLSRPLTRVSYYEPAKARLLKTVTISIKHGESLRGLKIFVATSARSPVR